MKLNIRNETSTLKTVVLGHGSTGRVPAIEKTFDARSYESVLHGCYPTEASIASEMSAFRRILLKHGVEVLQPCVLPNCNQVFARDVSFVIDDRMIYSNITPQRAREREAYAVIFRELAPDTIVHLPEKAHVEGGDVVLSGDKVFMGLYSGADYSALKTARTNSYALHFLQELFPRKTIIPIELHKHDTDPRQGVLHLDCTFMPVSHGKAILYSGGFRLEKDYRLLLDIFGPENIFEITREEMYHMNTNVFSISPTVVVSEANFERLNRHMEDHWGMTVERVPYAEIAKMGGLLRCSTLPLVRENDEQP